MDIEKIYYPQPPCGGSGKIRDYIEKAMEPGLEDDFEALLVAILYATAVTVSEILPFYTGYTRQHIEAQLKKLKGSGYITDHRFVANRIEGRKKGDNTVRRTNITMDGAKKFYCLTKKGKAHLQSMGLDVAHAYVLKETVPVQHSYATGYNYFEMLKLALPMEWSRETLFYYDRRRKQNASDVYRTDADCILFPDEPDSIRYIHIEQDMVTEDIPVLTDKCEHYVRAGLMNNKEDILVFSIWDNRANGREAEKLFNLTRIRDLIGTMKDTGASDIRHLNGRDEFWEDQDFLKELASVYGTGSEHSLSLQQLEKIASDIKYCRDQTSSDMVKACMNIRHAKTAFLRMYSFVKSIAGIMREEGYKSRKPDYMSMVSSNICLNAFYGSQLLFMATPLLAKRIPYTALGVFPDAVSLLAKGLSRYFGPMRFVSERTSGVFNTSDAVNISGASSPVCLRNGFVYMAGAKQAALCIEFMSMDAGAWFRTMMFDRYIEMARKENKQEIPLTLLLVFDNESQRDKYFITSNYRHLSGASIKHGSFNILYTYTTCVEQGDFELEAVTLVNKSAGRIMSIRIPCPAKS